MNKKVFLAYSGGLDTSVILIPNLIMELKTGKVDGLILAEPVAKQYATANPDLSLNGLDLGSEGGSAITLRTR